jgi:hypothetical protein
MPGHIQDGTGYGLMIFLDQAPKKGWISATTAKSYKAAVKQILNAVAEHPGSQDVRILDVEDALEVFEDARGTKYTEGSLASYKTRFRKAIEMYRRFLDDPDSVQQVRPRVRGGYLGNEGVRQLTAEAEAELGAPRQRPAGTDEMIEYPFPLSDGSTAYLRLPRNLLAPDVDRLIAFLKSLAIKQPRQAVLPLLVPHPE